MDMDQGLSNSDVTEKDEQDLITDNPTLQLNRKIEQALTMDLENVNSSHLNDDQTKTLEKENSQNFNNKEPHHEFTEDNNSLGENENDDDTSNEEMTNCLKEEKNNGIEVEGYENDQDYYYEIEFRGFLEPPDVHGHEKRWRH